MVVFVLQSNHLYISRTVDLSSSLSSALKDDHFSFTWVIISCATHLDSVLVPAELGTDQQRFLLIDPRLGFCHLCVELEQTEWDD